MNITTKYNLNNNELVFSNIPHKIQNYMKNKNRYYQSNPYSTIKIFKCSIGLT